MSVYVNEPTKVKLAPSGNDDDDDEDVKLDRVVYSPSTFTKQHAFKVAPPLPTFESMMFHEVLLETLKAKLDITSPTSFESQALPILLEERDVVAKAGPGYGKTLSLCLAAIFKALELKRENEREDNYRGRANMSSAAA